ncbi:MAG TPA: hypothetical protein VIZ65_00335 [Cellvibrionaceae bacterium]
MAYAPNAELQKIERTDGLKEQFLTDLENYLAETFCQILPEPKPDASNENG